MGDSMTLAMLLMLKDMATGPLSKFNQALAQTSAKFLAMGSVANVAGHKIIGALSLPIKSFADAEDAATRLRIAMMDASGTSKGFEAVNKLATDLGNKLPGTTADFQNMMTVLKQQGQSAESILGGVGKAAAYLAVQLKMPFDEAAKFSAKVGEAAGIASSDMTKFMDIIQRTANLGVETGEMQYAFGRSAGKLKEVGAQGLKSASDLSTLYAMLIKTGLSGETVGTNFSALLGGLQQYQYGIGDKAKTAQRQLKDLGIEMQFFDKGGKFLGARDMVAQLEKLNKLTPDKKASALNALFGGGQDAQMVSSLISGGVKAYDAMEKRKKDQADLNTKVEQQLKTLTNIWDAATGTFTNMLATLGASIAPELKTLADWFGKLAEKIGVFAKEHPQLTKMAVGLTAISGVSLVAGGAALTGIGMMGSAIGPLGSAVSFASQRYYHLLSTGMKMQAAVPGWNSAIRSKATSMGSAAKANAAWASSNLLTLSGLKNLISTGWARIVAGFTTKAAALRGAAIAGLMWVRGNLLTMTGLKALGTAGYARIVGGLRAIALGIRAIGIAAIANPVGLIVAAIVAAIAVAAVLIYKYWKPISGFFKGMWQGLKQGLAPLAPAFKAAFAPLAPLMGPIMGALKGVWNWFKNLLKPVDDVGGRAQSMGVKVGLALAKIIAEGMKVLTFFTGMAAKFTAFGLQMMMGLLSGITSGAARVLAKISEIAGSIKAKFAGLLGIHSPSRVFADYGKNLGIGLQLGMDSQSSQLMKAASRMAGAATPNMPQLATASNSRSGSSPAPISSRGTGASNAGGLGRGGAVQITFAPQISLQSNTPVAQQMNQLMPMLYSDFKRFMERYLHDKGRSEA